MAERFLRQIEFENAIYSPDCPVALEKGAILLDTQTNTYFLQMKFGNLGMMEVVSARVYVEALDRKGNPAYPRINTDYEEFAEPGSTFGTKKLIPLSNNNAVVFGVYVGQIVTSDGHKYVFPREQHVMSAGQRNVAAEREKAAAAVAAIVAEQEEQEEQAQLEREREMAAWDDSINFVKSLLFCFKPKK